MSDEDEEEANEMELENESHHKVCALHGGIEYSSKSAIFRH